VKLLVQGGRLVDPSQDLDGFLDVLIEDGVVSKVGESLSAKGAEVLDASGTVVAPGLIDIHVHLREPGQEYKETVRTGTLAAADHAIAREELQRRLLEDAATRAEVEELRRQIEAPRGPAATTPGADPGKAPGNVEDPGAELERLLKGK